ncbi:hypothetical protein [Nonomuraea sp. GTA35]|uniref:hypothetical protein n=1 Tax=Nonomuraea sp. GTA35 TaxID=1676746 RepID=UPI0035C19929
MTSATCVRYRTAPDTAAGLTCTNSASSAAVPRPPSATRRAAFYSLSAAAGVLTAVWLCRSAHDLAGPRTQPVASVPLPTGPGTP